MLKHCLLAVVAAGTISIATPFVAAQDTPSQDQPPASSAPSQDNGHGRRGMPDPAERTKELTQKLNLTADQQTKVEDALQSAQTQMASLRQDSSTSREDRRSKMMDIRKTTDTQIRGLLDATQQKKWDEMQAKREERMGRRQGPPNVGADQAPAPPQQ
jgi:Spy/CpxP family protein refolding chaperone